MSTVPDKPTLDGIEARWEQRWEQDGTFRFDRSAPREQVFSVDTPPPTVSGSLHVGHVFSYSHTDAIARFQRMRGKQVFYPMGWDDNGLPTERRVQNHFGVRCDPSLPYDPSGERPAGDGKGQVPVSRRNFVELCHRLTAEDEQAFERLWRRLGLSIDWSLTYATIDERAQRASQRGFLRNLARGEAYQAEAPTLWDVDFRTAVAQAELEDREMPGAYHRVGFRVAEGDRAGEVVAIETTRPELIPACVALVAHPGDARYQPLFGTHVTTPLFGVRVPVVAHELADPEKGSGIAMICTFGDTTDVTWWRELQLPVRAIIGHDGRLKPIEWGAAGWECADPAAAQATYAELLGKTAKQAQARIAELLRESGDLEGDPRPITHPVKFFEKGDRPLEIVTSRQWYIRNGGRDAGLREALLERGRELRWHPSYMRARYDSWVGGLNGDWLISRQRFFGVPIPLWYPVGEDGEVRWDQPIVPEESALPIDPSSDAPPGFDESQRGQPGGFVGDHDVMDTWATSSLTPQIAGGWEEDDDLFSRVFPYDLRPQAHEIIRTWLFSTIVRSHLEHGQLPWSDAAISGWVLDPDRKKMSKSKGNAETPMGVLEKYGSDAVRYWAVSGRPGTDTAFDEGQMKVGRRLAIKLLNASKFALSFAPADALAAGAVTEPLDVALLARLRTLVEDATTAFEGFDYARALERTEGFFWSFCDDYLELVKARAYGEAGDEAAASAARTLSVALSALHRLFAPFLPFAAEEVWSWWQEGSVHLAPWPTAAEVDAALDGAAADGGDAVLTATAEVLALVRKAKSEAKRSMKTGVERCTVAAPAERVEQLRAAQGDLCRAGAIAALELVEGDELRVDVELEPAEAAPA